ncbi:MAG TPA: hypothetical protein VMY34_09955 [Acidimicrobiales bacterium]|nr:hypothetical protein [Acidimicrobiales bacterium]
MNEVAKALHDGLDRLSERGLAKFQLYDPETGRVCARGALVDSTPQQSWGGVVWSREADLLLCEMALEQYPDRVEPHVLGGEIVDFNNHDDTTQEDVERVFEKAIVRAYELGV